MTRQEMFDFAVGKVLAQGGPSARETAVGVMCLYRSDNGRACLVGHFIADDQYVKSMEGCVSSLFEEYHLGEDHWLCQHEDFLEGLQSCHDDAATVKPANGYPRLATDAEFWISFKTRARNFAARQGLNPAVLDRVDRLMDAVSAFQQDGGETVERESLVTA